MSRVRTIRAELLDYFAAGGEVYISVHRGRWRRPVEIATTRDEALTLAEMIRHAEPDQAEELAERLYRAMAEAQRQRDAARAELVTARRDAAADALQMAGTQLATAGHYPAADLVRDLEAQIRAGTRPVPGRPEPAGGGNDAA